MPPENSTPLILAELVIRHAQVHPGEIDKFRMTATLQRPVSDTHGRLTRNSPYTRHPLLPFLHKIFTKGFFHSAKGVTIKIWWFTALLPKADG